MSILIKGTKMPETCGECQSTLGLFADECPLFAEFPKKFDYDPEIGNNRRYPGCPLVEIPPHGRLIDADKLEYNSIGCWARDEVRPPQDDTEWLISKYDIDEETPTVIESEEQEHE